MFKLYQPPIDDRLSRIDAFNSDGCLVSQLLHNVPTVSLRVHRFVSSIPPERVLELGHDPGALADRALVVRVDFVNVKVEHGRGLGCLTRAVLSLGRVSPADHPVFHPGLEDLLLRYFQRRVFERWRRNKPEPAFRISSPSPRFGRSRLSFKSGTYCRPVPLPRSECWTGRRSQRPRSNRQGTIVAKRTGKSSWSDHSIFSPKRRPRPREIARAGKASPASTPAAAPIQNNAPGQRQ